MSGATTTAATRAALFAGLEAHSAILTAQSDVDEQSGTLSPPTVAALVASGALRMKLPLELGGYEADLVTQMLVLERLATLNPAAGWCAMVGATSLGIARALLQVNAENRPALKAEGLLTRDSRMKERKKPGQPGARKRFQFSKR